MDRSELEQFVKRENEEKGYGVNARDIDSIIDLMAYVGGDLYRPLTRLLLSNWNEVVQRLVQKGATHEALADCAAKHVCSHAHHEETAELLENDRHAVEVFFEILEGEDTFTQTQQGDTPITQEELRKIRSH